MSTTEIEVLDNELDNFIREGEKVKPKRLRKGYFFLEDERMLSKIKDFLNEGLTVYQISDMLIDIDKTTWNKGKEDIKVERRNSKYFNQAQTLQRQLEKLSIIKSKEERKEFELKTKKDKIDKLQKEIEEYKIEEKTLTEEKKTLKSNVDSLKEEIKNIGLN